MTQPPHAPKQPYRREPSDAVTLLRQTTTPQGAAFARLPRLDAAGVQPLYAWLGSFGWGPAAPNGGYGRISNVLAPAGLRAVSEGVFFASPRAPGPRPGWLALWPSLGGATAFVQHCETPAEVACTEGGAFVPLLRLRGVPPPLIARGGALLSATLLGTDLWLEDVLAWEGRDVWATVPFRVRYGLLASLAAELCAAPSDAALNGGVRVRLRKLLPLAALDPALAPVWELQPDAPGRRRFLWRATAAATTLRSTPAEPTATPDGPPTLPPPLYGEAARGIAPVLATHPLDASGAPLVATQPTSVQHQQQPQQQQQLASRQQEQTRPPPLSPTQQPQQVQPQKVEPQPQELLQQPQQLHMPQQSSTPVQQQLQQQRTFLAKREAAPDVYTLLDAVTGESVGVGALRTLAVSTEMRRAFASPDGATLTSVRVRAAWAPTFGRWEILGVGSAPAASSSGAQNHAA